MVTERSSRMSRLDPEGRADPIERLIVQFHGHCGPWVALGYRMGRLARDALSSPGYFDLEAEVETSAEPPHSCLIDGVQLGSGCTPGKANLRTRVGEPATAVFRRRHRPGNGVSIRVRGEFVDGLEALVRSLGVEGAGTRVLGAPAADLFDLTSV